MKSNPDNPTHAVVFAHLYKDDFLKKENVIPPLSLRCDAAVKNLDFNFTDVAESKIPDTPLWISKSSTFIHDLASHQKAITDPMIFKSKYLEIKRQYNIHEAMYTDG